MYACNITHGASKRARDVAAATTTTTPAAPQATLPPSAARDEAAAVAHEQAHVHDVYRAIATHFSSTRYKAWPRVCAFLHSLPAHACVADVGCGNGKYFAVAQEQRVCCSDNEDEDEDDEQQQQQPLLPTVVPTRRYVLGLDYSNELLRLTQRAWADPNASTPTAAAASVDVCAGAGAPSAKPVTVGTMSTSGDNNNKGTVMTTATATAARTRRQPRTDVLRCDARACPLRPGVLDAAISIAVLHHYATHTRRRAALRELLRLVRPRGGRVLVYVWALEQHLRDGNNDASDSAPSSSSSSSSSQCVRKGRHGRVTVDAATGDALVHWEVHARYERDAAAAATVATPHDTTSSSATDKSSSSSSSSSTFARYYHLFRQGELEALCAEAAAGADDDDDDGDAAALPCRIVRSYYDKENWCVLLQRL